MIKYFTKSFLLLLVSVVICCIIYPLGLWAVGQIFFPFQANGSMLKGPDGKVVGSLLIAQPFTKDEYFQPRPSAASYDASASASSTFAPSNYALRDRVARVIGPIAIYKNGPRDGQAVASDVENWFGKDVYQGKPQIVAQWADMHNSLAQAWVNADPKNTKYVEDWEKTHPAIVAKWIKDNPGTPQPKAADLAVVFFESFSTENPGKFPSAVTKKGADGKDVTIIEPVNKGTDIQSIFFDMWRQEHPDVGLQDIPGDLVTASASGLDPDITLQNAEYQMNRVVSKWAANMKRNPNDVRKEIEQIVQENASAPWNGITGEKYINVLEVNLALCKKYGMPPTR